MPIDSTPDAQGIQHKPAVKPFPQPSPEQDGKDAKREEHEQGGAADRERGSGRDAGKGLTSRETDSQTVINRPPLGN